MKSILEILSYTGFLQGSLTGSLAVLHKRFNKPEFRLLGTLSLLMGLDCLCQNLLVVTHYPIVYWLNNGNLFLFGPLIYFFIKMVKSGKIPSRSEMLLHLSPFMIIKTGTLLLGPTGLGAKLLPSSFFVGLNHFLTFHGIAYASISLLIALNVKSKSNHKLSAFSFWMAILYFIGWISSFFGMQLEWYGLSVAATMWTITYVLMLTMIFIITVQLMLYDKVQTSQGNFIELDKPKYQKSPIRTSDSKTLIDTLNHALQKDKLYLDPELNRTKLAAHIGVSPHILSQLLNNHLNKSFSEYINEYRIEEAKRKIIDPVYNDYTILAIAYESGFKSKSSFQRLFKKYNDMTPSEYLEKMRKNNPQS